MNKSLIALLSILLLQSSSIAQRVIKTFYDENNAYIENENNAFYYRVTTFNKDNKSGSVKEYYKSGKISYSGKFSSTDLKNIKNEIHEGLCIFYYENGNKMIETNCIKGKEIGKRIQYNEDGRPAKEVFFINGEIDSQNTIEYVYHDKYYLTLKGAFSDADHFTGEIVEYYKGDTTIYFENNGTYLKMPCWIIGKPHDFNEKRFAVFQDKFDTKERSTCWHMNSDKEANVGIVNKTLNISFNQDRAMRNVYLDESPVSLNDNDFSISVIVDKESTTTSGLKIIDADLGYYSVEITQANGQSLVVYKNVVDGNFINDDVIDNSHYILNEDNQLEIKKRGNKITFSLNGFIIREIDNPRILNNNISLYGLKFKSNPGNQVYFKDFNFRVDIFKNIPNQISVKSTGGVYTLPVELNGVLKIDFIFDSGASDVSITPDVALTLIKAGTIKEQDWLQGAVYKFADGSTAKSKRFKLRSFKIGDRIIKNITCSISNSIDAPMLLGQSVMKQFGKYTFDNKKQVLIIE